MLGGGQSIVATGTNCASVTSVTILGASVVPTATTATTVTFTLPAHAAGTGTVALVGPGGTSGTLPFEYWSLASVATVRARYRADLGLTNVAGKASEWDDQSGAGDANRNLLQATAGNRPTINANDADFGNQASLAFSNALATFLQTVGTFTGGPYAQPIIAFFVARWSTVNNLFLYDDNGAGSRVFILDNGVGAGVNAYAGVNLTGGALPTGAMHAGIVVYNGVTSAVYLDASAAAMISGGIGANALLGLTVGANGAGSANFDGKLAELSFHSAADVLANRQKFMLYVNQRYGAAFV